MTNWQDTILVQYSASQKLISIIDTFNQAVSLDDFTDEFITRVWDVTTCETFGLDMWGKVVRVSRHIKAPTGETIKLSDDAYRTLILCKAFSNISIATIPEINRFLTMLFKGRGRAYCVNYGSMVIGITLEFPIDQFEEMILTNYEVTPIPSGVGLKVRQLVSTYFGYASDAYPFNDGTFFGD